MKFVRDQWYRLGLILFAALSFYMIFWGNDRLTDIQRILMASLMTLPLHQFEEYAMPGGGPVVINRAFYGEQKLYRHYPGNWNSIMVVNLSAYVFYILALLLPGMIWLGIAMMLFNLFQVLGHVLEMNFKLKTWYNPGMATSVFLFLPISVRYICFISAAGVGTGIDWAMATLVLVAIIVVTIILPVQCLKNENSPYDIPQWQIDQFDKVCSAASVKRDR